MGELKLALCSQKDTFAVEIYVSESPTHPNLERGS